MKHVTFASVPGEFVGGEQRLVPDGLAKHLLAEKKITDMQPWPAPADEQPTAKKPSRTAITPQRHVGGHDRRVAR